MTHLLLSRARQRWLTELSRVVVVMMMMIEAHGRHLQPAFLLRLRPTHVDARYARHPYLVIGCSEAPRNRSPSPALGRSAGLATGLWETSPPASDRVTEGTLRLLRSATTTTACVKTRRIGRRVGRLAAGGTGVETQDTIPLRALGEAFVPECASPAGVSSLIRPRRRARRQTGRMDARMPR